jgi:hypothetical protein
MNGSASLADSGPEAQNNDMSQETRKTTEQVCGQSSISMASQLNNITGVMMENMIKVKIGSTATTALLDTGASVNVVSKSFLNEVRGVNFETMPTNPTDIRVANGESIKTLGEVQLSIEMGGHRFDTTFLVLQKLTLPVIIGMQFFKEHKVTLDLPTRILSFSIKNCQSKL